MSYRHFRLEYDTDDLAWLQVDVADRTVNVLSAEVLDEFSRVLEDVSTHSPAGLVILSGKDNGFIAGADVSEFTRIENREEALAHIERGQRCMDALEALPFPSIALIHGFCMGGGTELALACDYRLALDDPTTVIGLPEIRLGIHPGFGGTLRAIETLGVRHAMDMMLSGRAIKAHQARRMGLVDDCVPERQMFAAARHFLRQRPPRRRAGWLDRILGSRPVRPLLARWLARKTNRKAPRDHYPAPYALIDLWREHAGNRQNMLAAEAASVARLITGDTANNLIRVFFLQERLKQAGRQVRDESRHVHVIGAGVMGGDIAAWCALKGFTVSLQDQSPERIAPAIGRAWKTIQRKLRDPRLVRGTMDRLIADADGYGLAKADIVIEAVFEDLDVKTTLLREIEPRMRPDALLATNTSSIPLEELEKALKHPDRLVALHFFNPVARMQLVEISSAPATSETSRTHIASFATRLSKLPVAVRSSPGFLVNRVLMPYMLEAVQLYEEGVSKQTIDREARRFGMPMGPLELADTVGLDICLSVANILSQRLGMPVPGKLGEMVDLGLTGRKNGQGFYVWHKGRPQKERDGKAGDANDVQDRLILRLLNEAARCLSEGIVDDPDLLDAGIVFGTGFAPFTGGPVHYMQHVGIDTVAARLDELAQRYGERFARDAWFQRQLDGE